MTSNLLGEKLASMKSTFDAEVKAKEELKVFVGNLNLIEFRCFSERILKTIEEADLIELIPEYVGRENPILKSCSTGTGNGMFYNPRGIAIDHKANEVYIANMSNQPLEATLLQSFVICLFYINKS